MQNQLKTEGLEGRSAEALDFVRSILEEKDTTIRELQETIRQLELTIQSQEATLENFRKRTEPVGTVEQPVETKTDLSEAIEAINLVEEGPFPGVNIYVGGQIGDRSVNDIPMLRELKNLLLDNNVDLLDLGKYQLKKKPFFMLYFYTQEPMAIPEDGIFAQWCTRSLEASGGHAVVLIARHIISRAEVIEHKSLKEKSGVCLYDKDPAQSRPALLRLSFDSNWNPANPEELNNIAKELVELARHFYHSTLDQRHDNTSAPSMTRP